MRIMVVWEWLRKFNKSGFLLPLLVSVGFGLLVYSNMITGSWQDVSWVTAVCTGLGLSLGFYFFCSCLMRLFPGEVDIPGGPLHELAVKYSLLFTVLLIVLPVIVFNLVHVFGPGFLLADDPSGYRTGIDNIVRMSLWEGHYILNAFTETFSWWMMSHYSPFVVRLLYLVIYLSGISLCIYWVSRRIFNLSHEASFLAAVIPAVYPLQFQIIAGVNLSYTLLGQLFALLAMIVGFCYLTRRDHSWMLLLLAGGLFVASTRQMEQAIFVSAAVIFIYAATSGSVLRKTALIVPVVFSSAAVLFRMLTTPRNAAEIQNISLDVIILRIKTFLLYLSPYLSPVHREYAIMAVAVLLLAGLGGFFLWPDLRGRINELPHFSWLPEKLRLLLLPGFVFFWTAPSILPFLALNTHMDARTMHLSGYGPWLLMAPGLLFILSSVLSFASLRLRKKTIVFICALIVIMSGLQHMQYAARAYEKGNYYWNAISSSLSFHSFSEDSQIVITDADTGTHNSYPPCSGYLARLLGNRTDLGGLVGPEFYYYDPFTQVDLWKNPMTGLKGKGNLHLFRFVSPQESRTDPKNGYLERFEYFLRVITDKSEKEGNQLPGDWDLFKLEFDGTSSVIQSGHGTGEYKELLQSLEKTGVVPTQICWGDPDDVFGCNSPLVD
jgi:hypothetical protein